METLVPLLNNLIALSLLLGAAVGLDFTSVDGIKRLMRMLQKSVSKVKWLKRPLEILTPSGDKTFFLAIIMAYLWIAGFDLNFLGTFDAFSEVNPTLLALMNTAMASLGANYVQYRRKRA